MVSDEALADARRRLDVLKQSFCPRCGRVLFVAWRTPAMHDKEHCDEVMAYMDDLERRQRRGDYGA